MRDLSERLRTIARWGTMTSEFAASDRIEWMAADELDRLRAENEELRELMREAVQEVLDFGWILRPTWEKINAALAKDSHAD